MKPVTIRGIPQEIEKMIRKQAKNKKVSLNKTLITFLEEGAGIKGAEGGKIALYHDLDHLCGVWTKEEAQAFEKSINFQRKVEEGIWRKGES